MLPSKADTYIFFPSFNVIRDLYNQKYGKLIEMTNLLEMI